MTVKPSRDGSSTGDSVPWARQPSVPVTRATTRTRNVVNDLPTWEPMPPGEILVQRHRSE